MTRHILNFPDHPRVRDQLEASVRQVDLLDLFETLAVAGNDILATSQSVFAARLGRHQPTLNTVATARAAAQRVIDACEEYEASTDIMSLTDGG